MKSVCTFIVLCWMLNRCWSAGSKTTQNGSGAIDGFASISHEMRDGKTVGSGHPDVLPLKITTKDKSIRLLLTRNQRVNPNNLPIKFSDEKNLKKSEKANSKLQHVSLYHDVHKHAALAVNFTNPDQLKVQGSMVIDGHHYDIKPVNEDLKTDFKEDFKSLHEIRILNTTHGDDYGDIFPIPKIGDWPYKSVNGSQKESPGQSGSHRTVWGSHHHNTFHVEILFLIDYSVYEYFLKMTDDEEDAKSEIKYQFSHMINAVELAYGSIAAFKITPWVTKIEVLTTEEDSAVTYAIMEGFNIGLDETFNSLEEYRSSHGYGWNDPDHIALFTRYTIGDSNRLGVAYLAGICEPKKAFSINQYTGFQTWATFAHELGHNMGAQHDGSNHCLESRQYLMAPTDAELSADTVEHAFQFSSCSITEMMQLITGSEYGYLAYYAENDDSWYVWPRVCLYDTVCEHGQELEGLDQPLGRRYNVDDQCKFYTGLQDAKSCSSYGEDFCYTGLMCHTGYTCESTYNIPAEGTHCGEDRICDRGKCTSTRTKHGKHTKLACTVGEHHIPDGCVNGQIRTGLISADFCEDAARKLPWAYFQPEYQYFYDHCAASMHKYGLYMEGGDPCPHESDGTCLPEEFQCDNGKCIHEYNVCDGDDDCGDNSDESQCEEEYEGCTEDEFTCKNGSCVDKMKKCNYVDDCGDASDETPDCLCSDTDLSCGNGRCVPRDWICDETDDCGDGSDETCCYSEDFQCLNGWCIPAEYKCDDYDDCPDSSDERDCDSGEWRPSWWKRNTKKKRQLLEILKDLEH